MNDNQSVTGFEPPQAEFVTAIESSRHRLLDALGTDSDIVFIHHAGDRGDELTWAGTRRMLAGCRYRERNLESGRRLQGHVAVVGGPGESGDRSHDPIRYLPYVERHFDRVVVLPSSIDTAVPWVRRVLETSRARFFAREADTFARIRELCDAQLAHDCAFMFDYTPYRIAGQGVLDVFRPDGESSAAEIPVDDREIFARCASLDEWLWALAGHETIRTDRVSVVIAAAMLGKAVQLGPSAGSDTTALVDFALRGFPIESLPSPVAPVRDAQPAAPSADEVLDEQLPDSEFRVRAQLLAEATRGVEADSAPRTHGTGIAVTVLLDTAPSEVGAARSIESLVRHTRVPVELAAIGPTGIAALQNRFGGDTTGAVRQWLEASPSGAEGHRLANCGQARYVLCLEAGIEVLPGTVELLIEQLEANPQAYAATATVVGADGAVTHSGGTYVARDGVLDYARIGDRERFDSDALPDSGFCDWVASHCALYRRDVLVDFDRQWPPGDLHGDLLGCLELNRAGAGSPLRCRDARAIVSDCGVWPPGEPDQRRRFEELIESAVAVHRRHGLVIRDLFEYLPELGPISNPRSVVSARLVLALAGARGAPWLISRADAGELDPLFDIEQDPLVYQLRREVDQQTRSVTKLRNDLDESSNSLGDTQRDAIRLSEQLLDRETRLARLEERLESRKQRIARLERQLVSKQGRMAAYRKNRKALRARLRWKRYRYADRIANLWPTGMWPRRKP